MQEILQHFLESTPPHSTPLAEHQKEHIKIEYHLHQGSALDEIIAGTHHQHFDLLVLGTKGASGLKERFFGSNTQTLIEKVDVPILAVPLAAPSNTIENIVFATDLEESEKGYAAIAKLHDFVQLFECRFTFLHVADDDASKYHDRIIHFRSYVDEVLGEDNYDFVLIENDSILEGLENYTREHRVDVLAMLRKKQSSLNRFFEVSFTQKMAFHGKVPVLIYKE